MLHKKMLCLAHLSVYNVAPATTNTFTRCIDQRIKNFKETRNFSVDLFKIFDKFFSARRNKSSMRYSSILARMRTRTWTVICMLTVFDCSLQNQICPTRIIPKSLSVLLWLRKFHQIHLNLLSVDFLTDRQTHRLNGITCCAAETQFEFNSSVRHCRGPCMQRWAECP